MIDADRARRLRADLAARLVAGDATLSAAWRPAFERVPRHLFVPRIYQQNGSGRADVLDSSTPDAWLAEVYRDEALVTSVHDGDHDTSLSSSSEPSVIWAMLDALDVDPGHRVLEVGTGTGYTAGLLCERLGPANVTSIDVDGELVAAARATLGALGHAPALVEADGADGYPANAPYDRVLATCAVPRVPRAWVEQTRPGGLICATMPYGMVPLRVGGDRVATGRFHPTAFAFMLMRGRGPAPEPRSVRDLFGLARGAGEQRRTAAAAAAAIPLRSALWMVVRIVALPELAVLDLGNDAMGYVDRASGSWARVAGDGVVEGGSRRVWGMIEDVFAAWRAAGEPDRPEIGLTVDAAGGQRLWLRDPDSPHQWTL